MRSSGSKQVSPSETIGQGATASPAQPYIHVIDGDSSRRFDLPDVGAVVIGRGPDCDLVLEHKSVSRRHAKIRLEQGAAAIDDLGSHNGTRVNGTLVRGPRTLASRDVVSVGDVVLVIYIRARPKRRAAISESDWRQRLEAETERALAYGRSLGVVAVDGITEGSAPAAGRELDQSLRLIDLLSEAEDGQLLLLCPELDRESTAALAEEAVSALGGDAPVRAGFAACPDDGLDADTLLFAARAAARSARSGQVATLADAAERISFGEHEVLLANPSMARQFNLLGRLASSGLPILISGETGVGKEAAAFAVHHESNRRSGPFRAINCAAIPEALVESELFGHDKGAFTGAVSARPGLLESLTGGTVFLDEVGELIPNVQAKLLRAVEAGKITRVGEVKERSIDVRIVAATNRDLEKEVESGAFREDLYFRLAAATVILPPLRDRPCEIPLLAREFLSRAGRPAMEIAPAAMARLLGYRWPGNVRELKNTIEFAAAAARQDWIDVADLPDRLRGQPSDDPPPAPPREPSPRTEDFRPIADEIRELEVTRMTQALEAAGGVKTRAAQLIGIPIRTFREKMKLYGLSAGRKGS